MNKFFEMGVMITLFIISVNAFVAVFGGGGPLEVVGYALPTEDVNISQADWNAVMTSGEGVTKTGDPYTETPGWLDIIFPGSTTIINSLSRFVTGYDTVLRASLPTSLHPIVTIVTIVLSFVQAITISYFILMLISIVRGGGVR